MRCYKCGTILNEKASFCSKCGFRVGEKEVEDDMQFLSEKERNELMVLDDPNVRYSSQPGGIWAILFGSKGHKHTKKRVVELRAKMRMNKLRISKDSNPQEYTKIISEEQKRFDEKFKI